MRKIKFRAYVYNPCTKEHTMKDLLEIVDHPTHNIKMNFDTEDNCESMSKLTKAIMQYVGQRDKNKKDIYEGDILRHFDANGEKIGVVEWMNELNSFRIVFSRRDSYYFIQNIDEIIGNVYEQPELLKG